MTTPVFTQASDDKLSDVSIQIVLPMNKDLDRSILCNAGFQLLTVRFKALILDSCAKLN